MRIAILLWSGLAVSGCNVIKPDLLDRTDAAQTDAKPVDAIDAPPDAYVPFEGNLATNAGLEDGTTAGWSNNGGGALLAISTTPVHGGTKSLFTSARGGNWNGPGIPIPTAMIRQGKRYTATVYARFVTNPVLPDSFAVSTRHTCTEFAEQRFNVNNDRTQAEGNDTTWVQPTSTFTVVGSGECTMTSFLVYVETAYTETGGTWTPPEFYVDDIEILEIP